MGRGYQCIGIVEGGGERGEGGEPGVPAVCIVMFLYNLQLFDDHNAEMAICSNLQVDCIRICCRELQTKVFNQS